MSVEEIIIPDDFGLAERAALENLNRSIRNMNTAITDNKVDAAMQTLSMLKRSRDAAMRREPTKESTRLLNEKYNELAQLLSSLGAGSMSAGKMRKYRKSGKSKKGGKSKNMYKKTRRMTKKRGGKRKRRTMRY
jgi:hypothetical protein